MTRFDRFRLDVTNQCLWHGRERVPLMPKPFAVLTHLVQHAGRLVTHDELLEAVWPDTHVQADVLRKHLKEIRRVLGDDAAAPRLIETVPKRGYRFIAQVLEEEAASSRCPPALVGRSAEYAALCDRFTRALARERQIVLIAGEAGMGKTSLVDAFQRDLGGGEPVATAWGQCVEGYGGKEPYYPLLEALGRLGRGPEASTVVSALAHAAPTWLNQLPSLVPAGRRESLRREAAHATQARMVRELCEALETMAESVALVLILEDLHWVDHSTLDALSAIARRREAARLLVVATYRPTGVAPAARPFRHLRHDLLMHRLAHEIALRPLGPADVAAYVDASYSPHALEGLDELVYRHSGGSPLFMTATLDHLAQQGVLARDGACWRLTRPIAEVEPGVPDTLRHVLALQVDGLTSEERGVLMAASVVGERFSLWAIEVMLGGDVSASEAICDGLAERGLVIRAVGPADAPGGGRTRSFEFTHALYREALYRRLTTAQRTEYHGRLAEALDAARAAGRQELAGETAAHFEAAGVDDRAFENLTIAAETALQRCAHHEAVALLGHARELAANLHDDASGERDVRLLQRIGDAHYAHGDMAEAAAAYDAAATAAVAARRLPDAAHAWLRVARAAVFFDVDRALASCRRAEELAARAGSTALRARAAHVGACWDLLHRGWSRERAAAAAAALDAFRSEAAPAERILWANVQVLRSEYADAIAACDAALRDLPSTASLWEQLAAFAAKAGALSLLGRYGEADDALRGAIALAARNENDAWLDILTGQLAVVHLHLFDFAGARDLVTHRLDAYAPDAARGRDMQLRVALGAAELGLGHPDAAARCFSDVIGRPASERPVLNWYLRLYARLGMVEVALARGEAAKADDEAGAITRDVAELDDAMIRADLWELRTRIALAHGAREAAELAADEAEKSLEVAVLPSVAWRVHATAAEMWRASAPARADDHRERARAMLLAMARSVEGRETLERAIRNAPAFRAIVTRDVQTSR